jgi:hypothetical protein
MCAEYMRMLDGETVFTVPNVPENAVLVRFNVLFKFAYIFEAAKAWCNSR